MYCERDYAKRMPPEKKLVVQELDDSLSKTVDDLLKGTRKAMEEENRRRYKEEQKRRTRNIIIGSVLGGIVIGLAIWSNSQKG